MNTTYWQNAQSLNQRPANQPPKGNIARKKFKKLRGIDLCWELVQPLSETVAQSDKDKKLRGFSPGQQALFTLWHLDSEVTSGGFVQFFWNGYAVYVPVLSNGLNLIEAKAMEQLITEAYEEYQLQQSTFTEYASLIDSPLYAELEKLNQMDFEYFRLHKKTIDKMEQYIRKYPEEFIAFTD
ncbi:DMP19 family protein [Microscilla marina]|uniref:DNA mimic protein DMP19 C-terminal domain-containing protein n=1 Tax=Microscilla marina ATCC 23134 TaxID=313606 RepID=A1ZW05_MICM2|nr:DUF4375 domain-containing protein [Microscilla marina]EAY25368.1 hypothetical protein M23134_06627 [Microscilla marina ATCC 23134]